MGSNVHAAEKLNTFICNFITLSTKPLLKVKYYVRKYMPFISFTSCWEKEKKKKIKQKKHLQEHKHYKIPSISCEHSTLNLSEEPGLESNPRFQSHPACHSQEDSTGDASAGGRRQMLHRASLTRSLREWELRPWCSALLSASALWWQLMRGDGGETREKKNGLLQKKQTIWFLEGMWKANWKPLWLEVFKRTSFFRVKLDGLKTYLKIRLQKCTCFLWVK